jgi:hypothetical protein
MDAKRMKIIRALFVTEKKAPCDVANKVGGVVRGLRLRVPKMDRADIDLWRLYWWHRLFLRLRKKWDPTHVGIENYAYTARSLGIYQYGEVGGAARLVFCKRFMRYHDPQSVKLFGSGNGRAETMELEVAVRKRWGVDFRKYNANQVGQRPSEDLTVAYVLARIVATEWKLRTGLLVFNQLDENAIRVFNRVTKKQPINILARDWLTMR